MRRLGMLGFALLVGVAGALRPVTGQGAKFALQTAVTVQEEEQFAQGLDLSRVSLLTWRRRFAGRAAAGDALAQWLYGRTFLRLAGEAVSAWEAGEAGRWFEKAAAQNYARGEYALYGMYLPSGDLKPDPARAARMLERAAQHAGGGLQYDILLELARQTDPRSPRSSLPGYAPSLTRTADWLRQAHDLDPSDTRAAFELVGLYVWAGDFAAALAWAERGDDFRLWIQAADWYRLGQPGLPVQPRQALALYRRALVWLRAHPEADMQEWEILFVQYALLEMECRQQLTRPDIAALIDADSEARYRANRQGCQGPQRQWR